MLVRTMDKRVNLLLQDAIGLVNDAREDCRQEVSNSEKHLCTLVRDGATLRLIKDELRLPLDNHSPLLKTLRPYKMAVGQVKAIANKVLRDDVLRHFCGDTHKHCTTMIGCLWSDDAIMDYEEQWGYEDELDALYESETED